MSVEDVGLTPSHNGVVAPAQPNFRRESVITSYERQLSMAKWAARLVGSLHAFCRFIALCILTWASAVLLGAFVESLLFDDYSIIVSLLLLQGFHLASSAFFTAVLTRTLTQLSQNPNKIDHTKDHHYRRALYARIASFCLQALLISPSFVLPILRLRLIHYHATNLQFSLLIFYGLVLFNASISSLTLIASSIAFIYLSNPPEQSILRYYDQILQNTLIQGVACADDFEFFDFTYRMLAKKYAANVQPQAVVLYNKELIKYLYAHRCGVDAVAVYLNAEDVYVQIAAANMVGFWADEAQFKVGLPEVKLTAELLTKLADKVGYGQVGWAASSSFGGLATRNPGMVAETKTSSGKPVLQVLEELVDASNSRSLTFVRTLVLYYSHADTLTALAPSPELVGKLKQLLASSKVHRLRVQSAYLLHLLNALDSSCYSDIRRIDPKQDNYWFQSELTMLQFFHRFIPSDGTWHPSLPLPPDNLREDRSIPH